MRYSTHAARTTGLATLAVITASCLYESPDANPERLALEDWSRATVLLLRETTDCEGQTTKVALALVGEATEFTGDDVAHLSVDCSDESSVAMGIDVNAHSVVFDFSTVAKASAFAAAQVDGYLIESLSLTPDIIGIEIDHDETTLDVSMTDLEFGSHFLMANFAGREFDAASRVKIDLIFADDSAN
ncbi:MAG: hypothetical protein AAF500_05695 [Myxococcota bacterium]